MSGNIEYTIKFEDGSSKDIVVDLDPKTGAIRDDDSVEGPAWTLLDNGKCSHCPYNSKDKKYCPVAKNLAHASETFKEDRSYKKVTAFVKGKDRFYGKQTDLQTALFSLFGLIMATSSCEHLHMFKTMARFHLPFSSYEETVLRSLGTYLLSEYLKQQDDPKHVIGLDGLSEKYQKIALLNQGIITRIRTLKGADATQNAVIVLDSFASLLPMEIDSGLSEVKKLFV